MTTTQNPISILKSESKTYGKSGQEVTKTYVTAWDSYRKSKSQITQHDTGKVPHSFSHAGKWHTVNLDADAKAAEVKKAISLYTSALKQGEAKSVPLEAMSKNELFGLYIQSQGKDCDVVAAAKLTKEALLAEMS